MSLTCIEIGKNESIDYFKKQVNIHVYKNEIPDCTDSESYDEDEDEDRCGRRV